MPPSDVIQQFVVSHPPALFAWYFITVLSWGVGMYWVEKDPTSTKKDILYAHVLMPFFCLLFAPLFWLFSPVIALGVAGLAAFYDAWDGMR